MPLVTNASANCSLTLVWTRELLMKRCAQRLQRKLITVTHTSTSTSTSTSLQRKLITVTHTARHDITAFPPRRAIALFHSTVLPQSVVRVRVALTLVACHACLVTTFDSKL